MSMTENEARQVIECIGEKLNDNSLVFYTKVEQKALDMAIQAIEEIQKYRAIGTIEEFKALKEKSVAKKSEWKYYRKENIVTCKNCSYEHYLGTYHQYATHYCPNCGSEMTET